MSTVTPGQAEPTATTTDLLLAHATVITLVLTHGLSVEGISYHRPGVISGHRKPPTACLDVRVADLPSWCAILAITEIRAHRRHHDIRLHADATHGGLRLRLAADLPSSSDAARRIQWHHSRPRGRGLVTPADLRAGDQGSDSERAISRAAGPTGHGAELAAAAAGPDQQREAATSDTVISDVERV